jgi:hypothetical protein
MVTTRESNLEFTIATRLSQLELIVTTREYLFSFLYSTKNLYILYPTTPTRVFSGGLPITLPPLIGSPGALRSKLPPQWLTFLFISAEFFVPYPELTAVTLNFHCGGIELTRWILHEVIKFNQEFIYYILKETRKGIFIVAHALTL